MICEGVFNPCAEAVTADAATLAQAAQVPTGVDACCAIYPAFLAAESTGTVAVSPGASVSGKVGALAPPRTKAVTG